MRSLEPFYINSEPFYFSRISRIPALDSAAPRWLGQVCHVIEIRSIIGAARLKFVYQYQYISCNCFSAHSFQLHKDLMMYIHLAERFIKHN